MDKTLDQKLERLLHTLQPMERVLVAYSGGVDSTFLARAALEVLGPGAIGVIARSPSYPEAEYREALETAEAMGLPLHLLETHELDDPRYRANPVDRCFYCKQELFTRLAPLAERLGVAHLLYGAIADDAFDHRPGREAALRFGVRAPLEEVGLTKAEIRALSRRWDLPTWDKPSFACLSSRFPYGQAIDREQLARVEAAEVSLRLAGFRQFRVRVHGEIARVELEPADFPRLLEGDLRERLVGDLRELGFRYVTLDLQGYRTGSLNEGLGLRILGSPAGPGLSSGGG